MDRSLDDVIAERQSRGSNRGGNRGYRDNTRDRRPPRDGIRKSYRRDEAHGLDRDWVHDRFDDDVDARHEDRDPQPMRASRRGQDSTSYGGVKLKIENVHYDLTEEDLRDLFLRKGPVRSVNLTYDRHDRSTGIAYIVYEDARDATAAIRDFDGANAAGQPIRITLVPPPVARPSRNPFDSAGRPGRSLFDRIDQSDRRRRSGSEDDTGPRRGNGRNGTPDNLDRYVPSAGGRGGARTDSRRRSPRRDGRGSRRPGQPRQPRNASDGEGRPIVGGRPKKTTEELDAEMADYWGGGAGTGETAASGSAAPAAQQDMELDDI